MYQELSDEDLEQVTGGAPFTLPALGSSNESAHVDALATASGTHVAGTLTDTHAITGPHVAVAIGFAAAFGL